MWGGFGFVFGCLTILRRSEHLNTWSPVCGDVWVGSGGVALLEEVCPWEQVLRFQKQHAIPSSFFLLSACASGCELSAVPAAMPA